jgi:site-specific DNA recombinase
MNKKLRYQIVQSRKRWWTPFLLHWVCLIYLLVLPPVVYVPFAESYRINSIAITNHKEVDAPYAWPRDETCAVVWLTASHPISLCKKKNDEEIDPRDMPPGTKVWIYLRHSTGDQSLDDQEAAVTKLAREKEWIVDRVFRDAGKSGRSTEGREAFELMIHLAKQKPRPADILIIWEFSRFARNQDHAHFHRAELRMNGWQILSMKDDIPAGPMSRIYEALIDWKNEQLLIDIRMNTMRGLRYIAEQGCLPVGKVAKGYTFGEKQIGTHHDGTPRMGRKPEPDPEVAPRIVKAFEMKARGAPYAAISKETGLYGPGSGSWNHLFRNRIYTGEYEFHGEVFTNIYPAIVSKELFEAVQKCLPERRRSFTGRHHPRRKGSSYFLANIAECAYCGGRMEGKSTQGYRYYVCEQRNERTDLCPSASLVPANCVETEILRVLLDHVLSATYLQDLLAWTNDCLNSGQEDLRLRIGSIRSELTEAERLAEHMARNFATMETPTRSSERLLREQDNKIMQLEIALLELEQEWANSRIETTEDEIESYVHRARNMIDRAEFFDLREVCEQLFSRIIIGGDECQLELHFPTL